MATTTRLNKADRRSQLLDVAADLVVTPGAGSRDHGAAGHERPGESASAPTRHHPAQV